MHQTIGRITDDFDSRWHFNTSIALLMEFQNELTTLEAQLSPGALRQISLTLVRLLAPFAPFTAQELWETLGQSGPVFRQQWPVFDPALAKEDLAEIPVQVNGKVRGHLHVAFGTPREELEPLAVKLEKAQPFIAGKQIIKIVIVSDKLVNIVVK